MRCEVLELLEDNRVLAMARDNLSSSCHVSARVGMKVFGKRANHTEENLGEAIANEMKMTVLLV